MSGFPSWLEVNLDAIGHNLHQVRSKTKSEVIPCVKANAYGHGLVPMVAYLMKRGVKHFLVAKFWESLQLRAAGFDCCIINMDPLFSDTQLDIVVQLEITQSIYQRKTAELLSAAPIRNNKTASVQVKVDTGLGRVGVRYNEASDLIQYISKLQGLKIEGMFSTLSEDDDLDRIQVKRLFEVDFELRGRGIDPGMKSAASSNALLSKSYAHQDAVRPGLILLGLHPIEQKQQKGLDLRQSLCFKARVEQVKEVEPGDSLTYARRFVARNPMTVGTLHVGYADCYPRSLTSKSSVKVKDKTKRILGSVSANHFLIDLTETAVKVGNVVEIISKEGEASLRNLAKLSDTAIYALLMGFNTLTPRVYLEDGKFVALSEPKLVNSFFRIEQSEREVITFRGKLLY